MLRRDLQEQKNLVTIIEIIDWSKVGLNQNHYMI